MSKCEIKISTDKLRNFVQISESIEQSLELAKRGTEEIKTELELLQQINRFHKEYDLLADALKSIPKTRSEIVTFKKELFTLVRKRIQLLRAFHKHCEDFKIDMRSMRQLQTSNDLEYEMSDDGSECEDADNDEEYTTPQYTDLSGDENEEEENEIMVLDRDSSPSTYV